MAFPVLTHLDLTGNQLLNAGLQQLASDPGSPFEGQIWQNTTSDEIKCYLNGVVQIVQSGTIVNADVDASAAIAESKLALASDAAAGTPSRRTLGSGATQAMPGDKRLDSIASPTSAVSLNSQKITGLADGTAAQDAATYGQLQGVATGLDTKASVRAATAAAGTLATSFANASVIDGVTLATGDRILIKNQAAPAENGIYTVNASGAPTRATDFDSWTEIPGSIVAVEVGTANADTVYLSTADAGGTLGTTAISFTKIAPAAGGSGTVVKYSVDIAGTGSATQFTVTHNLNTTDVGINVYDVTADLEIIVDKKRPTANTCRIDFTTAPANAKVYRVVVLG